MKELNNIYRIQDILELIENTDRMIRIHSNKSSIFMREQYEYRKQRLLKELLGELTDSKNLTHNMGIIMLSLKKFYPELIKMAKKEKVKNEQRKELKTLEEVFA